MILDLNKNIYSKTWRSPPTNAYACMLPFFFSIKTYTIACENIIQQFSIVNNKNNGKSQRSMSLSQFLCAHTFHVICSSSEVEMWKKMLRFF